MCVIVPKPLTIKRECSFMSSLKLTERKIRYIVRVKKKGQSYKQISTDLKISISTIKRVLIYWLNTNNNYEERRQKSERY
ncbi:MAG: hypothetical protein ACP5T1_06960 [Thermoplasmata archaeon]